MKSRSNTIDQASKLIKDDAGVIQSAMDSIRKLSGENSADAGEITQEMSGISASVEKLAELSEANASKIKELENDFSKFRT
jgi:methyl-accepting chemotaxis protein